MCAGPRSSQGQPPWIAYSPRYARSARTWQYPSRSYLGAQASALKVPGDVFEASGQSFELGRKVGAVGLGLLRLEHLVRQQQRGEQQHARFPLAGDIAHRAELFLDHPTE